MAHTAPLITASAPSTPFTTLGRAIALPFRAVASFWTSVLLASSRAEAAERLIATSDEALAAKGLTRAGELERIFDDRF